MSDTEDVYHDDSANMNYDEPGENVEDPSSATSYDTPPAVVQEPVSKPSNKKPIPTLPPPGTVASNDETLATFEEQQRRKEQRMKDEMEEYTEARKAEKEKETEEIAELKRKREERKKERVEEEKRLAEQRKEEEARRKIEEEERKKRKAEEEEKRRREKERRRQEAEKRKAPKTPNFTIVKKEGEEGKADEEQEKKAPQKTKEELEREKKNALSSRITPLGDLSSMNLDALKEEAKKLHEQLWNLVSNVYSLDERYKRQQYDIVELQERARAMSKTKKKGVASVQYDDSYDRMNDRFSNAPPKILVANKYEANLDRRSWKEKVDQYNLKEDLVDINKMYNDYMANFDETYDFTGGY